MVDMIRNAYYDLIKAFASKDGQVVVAFIFGSMFFISLIAAIFQNEGNMFIGIFALFTILSSIMLLKKQKNKNNEDKK